MKLKDIDQKADNRIHEIGLLIGGFIAFLIACVIVIKWGFEFYLEAQKFVMRPIVGPAIGAFLILFVVNRLWVWMKRRAR